LEGKYSSDVENVAGLEKGERSANKELDARNG